MIYEQRDIILIPMPFSDLSNTKKRPVLILSNNKHNADKDIVVCAITSNLAKKEDGILIAQKDLEEGRLDLVSLIKPYKIFSVDRRIVIKKLARLRNIPFKNAISLLNTIFVEAN